MVAIALSCTKTGEPVNPTSNLIGTYKMFTGVSLMTNGKITNQTGTGTLKIVRAASTGNTYEVTEDYGGYYRKYLATIDGNKLTIQDTNKESLRINNDDYIGELSGSGEAEEDTKTIRIKTITLTTYAGTSFKKVADVLGTR